MSRHPHPGFWLLLLVAADGVAGPRYEAVGEVPIANITPEEARRNARNQAFAEIISQAAGTRVSAQTLIVNEQIASYNLLQTNNARVVNSQCSYETANMEYGSSTVLVQRARCSGEVQEFGAKSPALDAQIVRAPDKRCGLKEGELFGGSADTLALHDGEVFCLYLRVPVPMWYAVFTIYEDTGGPRVNQLFPGERDRAQALRLEANEVSRLEPVVSGLLPGKAFSQETLIVLASESASNLGKLRSAVTGKDVAATMQNSVPMDQFDKLLGTLPLDQVQIKYLPYVIRQK